MARPLTGTVVPTLGKDGLTYRALRFTAYGKRRYLSLGAVSEEDARRELRHVLADVERGIWQPAQPSEPATEAAPSFHEYAEQWWLRNEGRFAQSTQLDYRWRLESHLLPYFKDHRLDEITYDEVERYIAGKLGTERPLSARSINMTVTLLAAILETALERDLIARNPAYGKRRRVRERSAKRSYLASAGQIRALLDAASELDREARIDRQHIHRRAMLATLLFAGLRISELCALRWRDVDLQAGWLHVGDSKTDAGIRMVRLRPALLIELQSLRADSPAAEAEGHVFETLGGGVMSDDNFRKRVLKKTVARADANLTTAKLAPLPASLTPHSLRRTFASILYALGEDPGTIMDEMGHTDPGLALRIYRQAMRRGEQEKAQLRALIEGTPIGARNRAAPRKSRRRDHARGSRSAAGLRR